MADRKPTAVDEQTPPPESLEAALARLVARQTGPLNLDAIEATGAVRFGRPASKVAIYYPDTDEPTVVVLPEPSQGEPTGDTERRIMAALKSSPTPLTRKQAATAAGSKSTVGRFGQAFRYLVREGKIVRRGDEYTDDARKFAELT